MNHITHNRIEQVVKATKLHILPEISNLIVSYISDDMDEFIDHIHEWFGKVKDKYTFGKYRLKFSIDNEFMFTIALKFIPCYDKPSDEILLEISDNFAINILHKQPSPYAYTINPINKLSRDGIRLQIGYEYNGYDVEFQYMSKFIYDFIQITNAYVGYK